MQALDYFETQDGWKAKVGDVVWNTTMPLKVMNIISREDYEQMGRDKHVLWMKNNKDFYKESHDRLLKQWKKGSFLNKPREVPEALKDFSEWADFDPEFDIYWANQLKRARKENGIEFPKNTKPAIYVAKFKDKETTTKAVGWWIDDPEGLFHDPTKIPIIQGVNTM